MLAAGADVNATVAGDGSPLIAAAGDGHVDVVRLLLDKGADPNLIVPGDGTALIAAAGDGHTDVVDLLLQRGADVNLAAEGDETALIQAAGDGHLGVVKLLVSRGADVNLGVWVATSGRWDVQALAIRGERLAPELRTPLSEARGDGHIDVVMFLISAGARD
jgi:ankyrin repeat protein